MPPSYYIIQPVTANAQLLLPTVNALANAQPTNIYLAHNV